MEPDNHPAQPPLTGEVLPPQAHPTRDNPLAVVSLILGILAACLSALSALLSCFLCCFAVPGPVLTIVLGAGAAVCGHVGLRQIAESGGREHGRAMAVAGLVTAYVGIGVALLVMIVMVVLVGLFLAGVGGPLQQD